MSLIESQQCAICQEFAEDPIFFPCHSQILCYPCYKRYLITAITDLSYKTGGNVKCPVCEQNNLTLNVCFQRLQAEDSEKIQDMAFQVYLRQTKDIQRCPLSTCTYAYLPQTCFMRKQASCPLCETQLSRPFSLSLTPLITFIYITFMTNNCPQCQIPIDRISGCYHMTCSCSHQFCWYCLKDYKIVNNSRYRQHNQKDCLFLLLTKIFTVLFCVCSLILVYSGNEAFNLIMGYLFRISLGVLRALLIDGAISIQFIVLNNSSSRRNTFRRLLLIFALMDIAALIIIYLIGDLALTMYIIGISLITAGIAVFVGMMVAFSVSTWFDYIR